MGIELTPSEILYVWDNNNPNRDYQATRFDYYNGDQAILSESKYRYSDGSSRTLVVTNWIKYIVDTHVGFALTRPIKVTMADSDADPAALDNYQKLRRDQGLDALDIEHYKNCLLAGYSVEVHSYDGVNITSAIYPPDDWSFLYDTTGDLLAAILKTVIPAGTFYKTEITDSDIDVYTVYDNKYIRMYYMNDPDDPDTQPTLINEQRHVYGRIPITIFSVSPDKTSFIGDDLISQQDVWNDIRSSNADDVKYNVDNLLWINGYTPDALYELDDNGISVIDKIRQDKVIVTNRDDALVKFLDRGNRPEKVEYDLKTTRADIHMMARVADIQTIVGTTGRASGIALKLKLQQQIEQTGIFTKFFEQGYRDRIDLINRIWALKDMPVLEDYNITFDLNIPVDETTIWQMLPSIAPYMTLETVLRHVPSIIDPAEEAKAKIDEIRAIGQISNSNGIIVDKTDDLSIPEKPDNSDDDNDQADSDPSDPKADQ